MRHRLGHQAVSLRASSTLAERRLWQLLRGRPGGFKFRRQVPIGRYIADFACLSARLIVEVDGQFHADQPSDLERDAWLMLHGWEVARYWNVQVRDEAENVLADIEKRLAERAR